MRVREAICARPVPAGVAAGVGVIVLLLAVHAILPGARIIPSVAAAAPADVIDASNPAVTKATMSLTLVQWGTTIPYAGTGPPGVILQVVSPGILLNWTLEAWANQTAPSQVQVCSVLGVHYTDWSLQTTGAASGGSGSFTATPSIVESRVAPAGDQCLLRTQATGVWSLFIRIEGKGVPPLGLYRMDSKMHFDDWDRRIWMDVRV